MKLKPCPICGRKSAVNYIYDGVCDFFSKERCSICGEKQYRLNLGTEKDWNIKNEGFNG